MGYVRQPRHRLWILRVCSAGNSYPDTWFDVDPGWFAVCQNIHIIESLQIGQAVEVDVNLQQTAVWDVAWNLNELQDLSSFVQFEEAILLG